MEWKGAEVNDVAIDIDSGAAPLLQRRHIPHDVWRRITAFLTSKDLITLRATSKPLQQYFDSHWDLWDASFTYEYGVERTEAPRGPMFEAFKSSHRSRQQLKRTLGQAHGLFRSKQQQSRKQIRCRQCVLGFNIVGIAAVVVSLYVFLLQVASLATDKEFAASIGYRGGPPWWYGIVDATDAAALRHSLEPYTYPFAWLYAVWAVTLASAAVLLYGAAVERRHSRFMASLAAQQAAKAAEQQRFIAAATRALPRTGGAASAVQEGTTIPLLRSAAATAGLPGNDDSSSSDAESSPSSPSDTALSQEIAARQHELSLLFGWYRHPTAFVCPLRLCMACVGIESLVAIVSFACFLVCLFLTSLFINMAADGVVPPVSPFIPFWCCAAIYFLAPCLRWDAARCRRPNPTSANKRNAMLYCIGWLCMFLMTTSTVVFGVRASTDSTITAVGAFIPFWVLESILLLILCCIPCFIGCCALRVGDRRACVAFILTAIALSYFVVLPFTFTLLLAIKTDDPTSNISWSDVTTPLQILMMSFFGPALALCCRSHRGFRPIFQREREFMDNLDLDIFTVLQRPRYHATTMLERPA